MDEVRAVCFDLDDTLCVHDQSEAAIHRAVFDREGIDPLFGVAAVRSVDPTDLERADSDAEFYGNIYRAAADPIDADPDPDLFARLGEHAAAVVDPTAVSFRPGAVEALEHARDNYRVGLITNGGEETQRPKLDALGIADAFDATVFCAPDDGVDPKPSTVPFERALSALSVDPAAAVHVGDRHGADVVGAHRAGLHSVWVPRADTAAGQTPDPAPTHRLSSPADLPTVF